MFTGVHHLGYLVESLDDTVALYEKAFGGRVLLRKPVPGAGEVAFVVSGGTMVELIEPLDKSAIAGKGGMVYDHVGYTVPDIEAAMADERAKGMKFAVEKPNVNVAGWKIAYFDKESVQGARIHLTEV
jgi:methylmalonyl-CoA/ethylmalonyl-CoA epimerase